MRAREWSRVGMRGGRSGAGGRDDGGEDRECLGVPPGSRGPRREEIDEQPAGILQRFRPGGLYQRYFEALGRVRRAVSVIKKRGGQHEKTIREYEIGDGGLKVGPPLDKFQGVLRGVPNFVVPGAGLMDERSA